MIIDIFSFILLIIFGLGFGSFATMAIYRIPNNMPWISEKPFCPKCKHELYFRDYFSIISFFIYKGSCRFCNGKIEYHFAYFVTEVLILSYFMINYLIFNFSDPFIINAGIILAVTIWSVIFVNSKQNIDSILKICLVFICLKKISLGLTVTDLILEIFYALMFVLINWHIFFLLKNKASESLEYLKFSNKNRFADDKFLIIKISILLLISLPLTLPLLAGIYVIYLLLLNISNRPRINLAILAQLIVIANLI
ncbi:MAG: prepilin peptidase [Rickettsiales bacterium]|jgi:prepilin signal peptidase PulO-like enzyme (type II secretory pathway)|nr:prepilin peptidase [Rickettsiales bacterium]